MQDLSPEQQLDDLDALDHWTTPASRSYECSRFDRNHAIVLLRESDQHSEISVHYERSFGAATPERARHVAAKYIRSVEGMVFVRGARR